MGLEWCVFAVHLNGEDFKKCSSSEMFMRAAVRSKTSIGSPGGTIIWVLECRACESDEHSAIA